MNLISSIILGYVLFALSVALTYTYLYHVHFMPSTVHRAKRMEKLRVYGMLFGSVFLAAPYCLYEMIKTKRNGGFSK